VLAVTTPWWTDLQRTGRLAYVTERPELPGELAQALTRAADKQEDIREELDELEAHLRKEGHAEAADQIEDLRESAAPAGLWGRVGGNLRSVASRQWELFLRELGQSRTLLSLLTRRVKGEIKHFSTEEESLVRAQLADVFRAIPATAMALAPVPGAALITPFVLRRLGLLPSVWRHAHLLDRLERTARSLDEGGLAEEATRVRTTARRLEETERDREDRIRTLLRHPQLRVLYDFDRDGVLGDEEWQAIKADRERLLELVRNHATSGGWYSSAGGEVQGPFTLADLLQEPLPDFSLIHAPGLDRWLPVEMIYETLAALEQGAGDEEGTVS